MLWPLLGVLAAGALFAPLRGGALYGDAYWYLDHAMQISLRPRFESLLVPRPVFPAMIAGAFALLGPGALAAFAVARACFVLNLGLAFLLGTSLRDRRTGLLAAGLLLTSFTVNRSSSYIRVDTVIVTFVLLFLLLCVRALRTGSLPWYAGAGGVLGLAFLTKEVIAAPFLGLPVLLLLRREQRSRRTLAGAAFMAAAFLAVLAPFAAALAGRPGGLAVLLGPLWVFGRHPQFALSLTGTEGAGELLPSPGGLLLSGLDFYLRGQYVIWPLLLAALAAAVVRAARRGDFASQFLLASLVLSSPVFLVTVRKGYRAGQLLLLGFLLLLLLALALRDLAGACGRWLSPGAAARGAWLAVAAVVLWQALAPARSTPSFASLLGCDEEICFTFWRRRTVMHSPVDDIAAAMVRWGLAWVRPGERLGTFWRYGEAVRFYSRHRVPTAGIENLPITAQSLERLRAGGRDPGPLLYLSGYEGVLWGQYEGPLLERINRGRVRDLVWVRRPQEMSHAYFTTHPDFRLLRSLGGGTVRIYRLLRRPARPHPAPPLRLGPDLARFLRRTVALGPEARDVVERSLGDLLGWPAPRVAEMVDVAVVRSGEEFSRRYAGRDMRE